MGMNNNVNLQNLLKGTLSGQIAQKLDAMDGKADGKIDANIWNAFANEHGGKTIKSHISVENAMNSISTYAIREQRQNGGKINDIAKNWFTQLGDLLKPKDYVLVGAGHSMPKKVDIPPADMNVIKTLKLPSDINTKLTLSTDPSTPPCSIDDIKNLKQGETKDIPGKGTLVKGENNTAVLKDSQGRVIAEFDADDEEFCIEYTYDDQGNKTSKTPRDKDGNLSSCASIYEYDSDENRTEHRFGEDGTFYLANKKDKNGKTIFNYSSETGYFCDHTKDISGHLDQDGKLKDCEIKTDVVLDGYALAVTYDKDGKVIKAGTDFCEYDANGDMVYYYGSDSKKHKPDGTNFSE